MSYVKKEISSQDWQYICKVVPEGYRLHLQRRVEDLSLTRKNWAINTTNGDFLISIPQIARDKSSFWFLHFQKNNVICFRMDFDVAEDIEVFNLLGNELSWEEVKKNIQSAFHVAGFFIDVKGSCSVNVLNKTVRGVNHVQLHRRKIQA